MSACGYLWSVPAPTRLVPTAEDAAVDDESRREFRLDLALSRMWDDMCEATEMARPGGLGGGPIVVRHERWLLLCGVCGAGRLRSDLGRGRRVLMLVVWPGKQVSAAATRKVATRPTAVESANAVNPVCCGQFPLNAWRCDRWHGTGPGCCWS